MKHFVSKDGTRIAYKRSGVGPPLVIIHGTGIDHTYWDPIAPRLEQHFTVYTVDRRGRGQSGDTEPYAIQREFEDVATLVDSIPEKVFLLGHSYGALCSLEAALLTTNISKLVLNEPPIYTTVEVSYPADAPDRFFAYLRAGEAEKALLMLYEIGGMSTAELNLLRSLPSWQARILAAPTIPREVISVRNYSFNPSRFRNLKTPILFLLGSESTPVYKAATETLHSALSHSRLVVLLGQQHDAVVTAPDLFLREIILFFLGNS
jgi:pimeloyl-ACP methyl ester carboxylesterase